MTGGASQPVAVPFMEAARLWWKVGFLSFGGAAAQIAMLHRLVVDERKWIDDAAFVHLLNYCMLLPGPEAQQLATFIGWKLHGWRGGLLAGSAFVIPGAVVMLGLCALYVYGAGLVWVDGLFLGVKCAVLAIIVEALMRIAKRALKGQASLIIAITAFLGLLLFGIPFPILVLAGAIAAASLSAFRPDLFGPQAVAPPRLAIESDRWRGALSQTGIWLAVWFAPVALAALMLGKGHVVVEVGLFFSKLAVLTFGGAYALLAWLAQEAVEVKGWVSAGEMLDGLGLAETTPGPTILVNQFVGFLAGYRNPGGLPPLFSAVLAAGMTVWVTFTPSFLWIFAGAPFVDDLRRNPRLAAALAGITATVVGVVAYLAFWFALKVLFSVSGTISLGPIALPTFAPTSLRWPAAVITAIAVLLLIVWHRGLAVTLIVTAALGIAVRLAGLA